MPLHIFNNPRKAGVRTDKVDPEPYFSRWEACVVMGSKDQPELIGQPCYKHKTCGHLTKVPHNRIPPVVCAWCGTNTLREELMLRPVVEAGAKIFEFPQTIVNLKKQTFSPFSKINHYLRNDK